VVTISRRRHETSSQCLCAPNPLTSVRHVALMVGVLLSSPGLCS
jgi:hypothetical protein